MKIICDNCRTKYSIADEKVKGKVFKIRCKKCSNIIVVRGNQSQTDAFSDTQDASAGYDAGHAAHDGEDPVWHLVIDQKQVGPMTASEVRDRFARGEIDAESYIWREGFSDWQRINQIEEFADIAQTTTVASPGAMSDALAQMQAPAAEQDAGGQQPSWGVDAPAAASWEATAESAGQAWEAPGESQQPSAWNAGDQGGVAQQGGDQLFGGSAQMETGRDLFGSHSDQDIGGGGGLQFGGGGEAAAPAAQPVPQEGSLFGPPAAQGATSDLFGGGGAADVGGPQMFPSGEDEPKPSEAQLTGARNENSVLFSLTNLQALAMGGKGPAPTAAAGVAPSPASSGGTPDSSSGLIDIRSMASSTAQPGPAASGGSALPDLGGFSSPIAAAPVLIPAMGEDKPKWLLPTIIGGGALLLIAVVVLVVVLVTKTPPPPVVVADVSQVAKQDPGAAGKTDPAASNTATASGDTTNSAKTEATDKGSEDTKADKPKTTSKRRRSSGKRRSSPSRRSSSSGSKDILEPESSGRSRSRSKPARKRDALDDLIDSAVGGKKASPRPRTTSRRSAESSAPDPNLPDTLSRAQIQGGMRGIKGKVQGCYDRYKVPGLANVQVKIGQNGRVSSARVKGMFSGTPTGACVQAAAQSARFSRFSGSPITITYPFILR